VWFKGRKNKMSWNVPFAQVRGETQEQRAMRVESALEAWYYKQQSNVEFHTHVVLYQVVNVSEDMHYSTRDIDPYRHLLFLFYRERPHCSSIEIMGTIEGHTLLYDLRGHFTTLDMKRVVRVQRMPLAPVTLPECTEECFYFPMYPVAWEREDVAEFLATRVEWLLMCFKEKDYSLPYHGGTPTQDVASFQMTQAVMHASEFRKHIPYSSCDADKVRNYFEQSRLCAEKERFLSRFAAFLSEDDVLRLVRFNGLAERMLERNDIVQGDASDMQTFYRRFPQMPRPTLFFVAPLEEVPVDVATQLPLKMGGVLHLSYLDVAPWVWNTYEIHAHRQSVLMQREDVLPLACVREQARFIFSFVTRVPQKGARSYYSSGPLESVDRQAGLSLASQDLLKALPPCLQRCASNHFPRNRERMSFVSTLSGAGVSMDSAQDLFRDLNNRHPKGYTRLESRFLLEPVWKRNYNAVSCKTIIAYTTKGDAEQIQCPYVQQTQTDNTYANCHHCKADGDIPDIENMYSPAMYLKYQLTRGAITLKAKKAKEDDDEKEPSAPFSSDDDLAEEEWSEHYDMGSVGCESE